MGTRSMNPVMRRGATLAGIATLGIGVAFMGGGSATAGTPPASFAFAIGNQTLDGDAATVGARYAGFDLVVVDGEEASAGEIAAIQAEGATVLGYLSVGTIEQWRSWYPDVKRYRLQAWQDWKDEWFADTSKAGFRRQVADEIAPGLLAKGFNGLFLDNTDMVEVRKHREQRAGMERLIQMLASLTHDDAKLLYSQNGAPGMLGGYPNQDVEPLAQHFDGWNREDVTWTFDFERRRYVRNSAGDRNAALGELESIGALGLVTMATDYVDLDDNDLDPECEAVANASGAGALPYVADIGLTRKAVEANPPDCG
jgi:hypothetical protein